MRDFVCIHCGSFEDMNSYHCHGGTCSECGQCLYDSLPTELQNREDTYRVKFTLSMEEYMGQEE